jgi:prepilin-type N-terminal cleavage/methylation domain-containing protein
MTEPRRSTTRRSYERAFTLLEVLAVIVLIAVATAAVATGFSGAVGMARLRQSAATMQDLDRKARLAAITEGAVRLLVDNSEPAQATVWRLGAHESLFRATFPPGVAVRLSDASGAPLDGVWFDSRGRSLDYAVTCSLGSAGFGWTVAGLTGWTSGDTSLEVRQ